MSLSQRIADRRQTDITPLHERRATERRGTPVWIRRMTERQLRGLDGLPVADHTYDVTKEAA